MPPADFSRPFLAPDDGRAARYRAARYRAARYRAALPGTCGELVQGSLDGRPCLVSCPIDRYGQAEVCLGSSPAWDLPLDAPKAAAALRAGLAYLDQPRLGGSLRLRSALPRSRGYASSTVDVGAALFALGEALGRPLEPWEAARLAVQVEPSDSTFFPGLALFAHRDAAFFELLGPPPALLVLVIDPGGEVDTLAFNRNDCRAALRRLAVPHREAFDLLRLGLRERELAAVGAAASLSARLHQQILPNPLLEPALALARHLGALGLCRAHSGTLLGLLFDPAGVDLPATLSYLSARLAGQAVVSACQLVAGGPLFFPSAAEFPAWAGV